MMESDTDPEAGFASIPGWFPPHHEAGRVSSSPGAAPVSDVRKRILAEVLLVAVAAVWGATFVMVKDAVALYPTMPFLALRFGLATLVLAPLALLGRRTGTREGRRGPLWGGLVMGLFLGAGYIFQTLGLERTTASNAGFITGLFVVLTPVLQGILWRRWIGGGALVGVVLATGGLFLLSGGAQGGDPLGDGLVVLCALSFAAHILATARYAGGRGVGELTMIQLGTVALLTGALSVGGAASGLGPALTPPREPTVLLGLAVTAILASAAGFYIQTFAQKRTAPTRTAVILTMEPVFAGFFGYVLAGERLHPGGWVGAALILGGMLVSEFTPRRRRVGLEEAGARDSSVGEGGRPASNSIRLSSEEP